MAPESMQWRGFDMTLRGLNFQSIESSPILTFEKTVAAHAVGTAHGRSVVYLGYYLPDDTATVASLNAALNAMGITHALFTFVTCPTPTGPISLNYSMTNDFFSLSSTNRAILTDPANSYTLGVSFGGASDMAGPVNSLFEDGSYYGGADGLMRLAKDLAWACSPPVCSTYPCTFLYRIIAGDSCASIAAMFGITPDQLLRSNPSLVCSPLETTQQYTVRQGDYCYLIAETHGISLADFLSLNPGLDCSQLQVGQTVNVPHYITIPGSSGACDTYVVRSGDTCSSIAKTHGMSLHDLYCANPGLNCTTLQIGQTLMIPPGPIPYPPAPPVDGPFLRYIDLDLENIDGSTDAIAQSFADHVGVLCRNLRTVGFEIISHAPQPPYFTDAFHNVYMRIYEGYRASFDFFNIQYYNNGPSESFEQIFLNSQTDGGTSPDTAVAQLIARGIDPAYIVVGKPSEPAQGTAGGYVPLATLSGIFEQAYGTPSLASWCSMGGAMIYYYSTTSIPSSPTLRHNLDTHYLITYPGDSPGMDQNVQNFFTSLRSFPC